MNIEVRYYTRGGNTRRLAETVAKAMNVEARTVDAPMDVINTMTGRLGRLPGISAKAAVSKRGSAEE